MTTPRGRCRSCGAGELTQFLSLGDLPLADAIVAPGADLSAESRYPVRVGHCACCALVQLLDDVDPELLFGADYPYFPSFADAGVAHSSRHARAVTDELGLTDQSLVLEVGSNDGMVLREFARLGVGVLGVDPVPRQADVAEAAGVPTVTEFFDVELAHALADDGVVADLVVANNVLAHVPDPNSIIEGASLLLAEDGSIRIENPSVVDLVDRTAYDTIYHEHFSYLSCTAVQSLAHRHGLHLNHVEQFPDLHGGTQRWHLGRDDAQSAQAAAALEAESQRGVSDGRLFEGFGERVGQRVADLHELVAGLVADGARIVGYGAAAKAAVLANVGGLTTDLVGMVADRNPHKQGWCLPGTHQPIVAPEAVAGSGATHLLIFAWNLLPEIVEANREFAAGGGRFIVPIPEPRVVQ